MGSCASGTKGSSSAIRLTSEERDIMQRNNMSPEEARMAAKTNEIVDTYKSEISKANEIIDKAKISGTVKSGYNIELEVAGQNVKYSISKDYKFDKNEPDIYSVRATVNGDIANAETIATIDTSYYGYYDAKMLKKAVKSYAKQDIKNNSQIKRHVIESNTQSGNSEFNNFIYSGISGNDWWNRR